MGGHQHRKVKRCIFCETNKADSQEHGWSDWAIKRFATPTNRIAGHSDGVPQFDRTQKSVRVRCVCVPCNTGWMKGLEDAVIPTVGKMASGAPTTLGIVQQWTIARWAITKAMVWEFTTKEHEIFYSAADRHLVMKESMPPNTTVWLSGHVGRETFYTAGARCSSLSPHGIQPEGYFTTMAYQRLVIQVMTIRPYEQTNPYALIDCNQTTWGDSIIRIWPTAEGTVLWPPLMTLDGNMLETFHRRCDQGAAATDSPRR